jgi:ABC-type Zn2+ transport system substrate-binding protein/surface adhesin
MMPSRTSVSAISAVLTAIRKSHASASSRPPPNAEPFITQTVARGMRDHAVIAPEIASMYGPLSAAPTHAFVSTHSAWVYYARRYGLDEIGAIYASPGREPSSRHLAQLVDGARAAGVRAVFIEPQLGEAGARTVASELGVGVHLLDPQGGEDQPGRDSYASLLRLNTAAMVEALGGGG